MDEGRRKWVARWLHRGGRLAVVVVGRRKKLIPFRSVLNESVVLGRRRGGAQARTALLWRAAIGEVSGPQGGSALVRGIRWRQHGQAVVLPRGERVREVVGGEAQSPRGPVEGRVEVPARGQTGHAPVVAHHAAPRLPVQRAGGGQCAEEGGGGAGDERSCHGRTCSSSRDSVGFGSSANSFYGLTARGGRLRCLASRTAAWCRKLAVENEDDNRNKSQILES